jgi:hypothetical protein
MRQNELPEGAEWTEEGLLPRMDSHVEVQLLLGDKLLVAVLAQEVKLALVALLARDQLLLIPDTKDRKFDNKYALICAMMRIRNQSYPDFLLPDPDKEWYSPYEVRILT